MDLVQQIQDLTIRIDKQITPNNMKNILQNQSLNMLLEIVSEVCAVDAKSIIHGNRERKKIIAREVFAFVAKRHLKIHEKEIAQYLKKNRVSVLYYVRMVDVSFRINDPVITQIIKKVLNQYLSLI